MKFIAYEVRNDEKDDFKKLSEELGIEIILVEDILTDKSINIAKECIGITILGQSKIDSNIIDKLVDLGIKFIATRTAGYNHIDIEYARKRGIKVSNANYEPNGVADYTVMLILMCIRHYKQALFRGNVNDYSLIGLKGKEMRSLTIGVIGTGKIGADVIQNLSGFGCNIIAYDKYVNSKIDKKVKYVELEELYKNSDVITLHTPLMDSTYHIIDNSSISLMKEGVVLINCARGELMDLPSLIEGIENRKIGALGLDVVENEEGIYHLDRRTEIIKNRNMAYLRQFPNVIMTQHMAFYTEQVVSRMVGCAVNSLVSFTVSGESENEIY